MVLILSGSYDPPFTVGRIYASDGGGEKIHYLKKNTPGNDFDFSNHFTWYFFLGSVFLKYTTKIQYKNTTTL